jgi:hypothetical protein
MEPVKISIGVPFYGMFSGEWTTQSMQLSASIAKEHTLVDIITSGTMTADHNRNLIVQEFLKSAAEWLFWVDSDTLVPIGAVNRMLAHGRTLVSGLYYGKNEPHNPIAYYIYNGAFRPIDQEVLWDKGAILEVAATGMGCMLTHRSVFEEIEKVYRVFQIPGGGLKVVHKDDISPSEGVEDGVDTVVKVNSFGNYLTQKLVEPTLANMRFPFFMIEHVRTEDMFFFDLAARVGHRPVLDTSVECGHLRWDAFTGKDYRNLKGH